MSDTLKELSETITEGEKEIATVNVKIQKLRRSSKEFSDQFEKRASVEDKLNTVNGKVAEAEILREQLAVRIDNFTAFLVQVRTAAIDLQIFQGENLKKLVINSDEAKLINMRINTALSTFLDVWHQNMQDCFATSFSEYSTASLMTTLYFRAAGNIPQHGTHHPSYEKDITLRRLKLHRNFCSDEFIVFFPPRKEPIDDPVLDAFAAAITAVPKAYRELVEKAKALGYEIGPAEVEG